MPEGYGYLSSRVQDWVPQAEGVYAEPMSKGMQDIEF